MHLAGRIMDHCVALKHRPRRDAILLAIAEHATGGVEASPSVDPLDLRPFASAERRAWFDDHSDAGPHRLLVACDEHGRCIGFASGSRWRPKPAYDTTVEVSPRVGAPSALQRD